MKIISNCCFGGFFSRDVAHDAYNTPFVWGWMNTEDTLKMLLSYEEINFANIKLDVYDTFRDGCCFKIIVDDKLTFVYSHYIFNSSTTTTYTEDINVKSNRIWEYVIDKYMARLHRMRTQYGLPIFMICDNRIGCGTYTDSQVKTLSGQCKYKVVFCSCNDYSKYTNDHFYFIHHHGNEILHIRNHYGQAILSWLTNQ